MAICRPSGQLSISLRTCGTKSLVTKGLKLSLVSEAEVVGTVLGCNNGTIEPPPGDDRDDVLRRGRVTGLLSYHRTLIFYGTVWFECIPNMCCSVQVAWLIR